MTAFKICLKYTFNSNNTFSPCKTYSQCLEELMSFSYYSIILLYTSVFVILVVCFYGKIL